MIILLYISNSDVHTNPLKSDKINIIGFGGTYHKIVNIHVLDPTVWDQAAS